MIERPDYNRKILINIQNIIEMYRQLKREERYFWDKTGIIILSADTHHTWNAIVRDKIDKIKGEGNDFKTMCLNAYNEVEKLLLLAQKYGIPEASIQYKSLNMGLNVKLNDDDLIIMINQIDLSKQLLINAFNKHAQLDFDFSEMNEMLKPKR